MKEHKPDDEDFFDRLIILASRHGATYLGWLTGTGDPGQHIENCCKEGHPVELEDVRILASQLQTIPDQAGNVMVNNMMLLIPIDTNARGLSSLKVLPSSWYFPKDNPDCQAPFKKMFQSALQMEVAKAVSKMNIVVAGSGTRLPPPPGGRMQ